MLRDSSAKVIVTLSIVVVTLASCAPAIRSTTADPAAATPLAELWREPEDVARRDLFYGVGGQALAPDPRAAYRFLSKDTKGFSGGYDVADASGMEWSVKVGPEAQTEVVASRLIWAAGYHQPPTYYLPQWRLEGGTDAGLKGPARFRPKVAWLHKADQWPWHRNAFVDTTPFRGLIVLNLMLNNADLRTPNNIVYTLPEARDGARRWFVVRDLGASLGATGFIHGTRNDLEGFERQGFITRVTARSVEFDYHGRHRELLRLLTAKDVRWAAERWAQLTDEQWAAAFRAADYSSAHAGRYIAKLRGKVAQGLALNP